MRGAFARVVLQLVLALAVGVSRPPVASSAQAAEIDLDRVTSPTVAEARQVVASQAAEHEFPWSGDLTAEDAALAAVGGTPEQIAKLRAGSPRLQTLPGAASVLWEALALAAAPETRRLANGFREFLHLPNLGALTPEAAAALAAFPGPVLSIGLSGTLTADVATALITRPGWLSIAGVTRLEPATAAALAGHPGYLLLPDLATLDAETAAALAGKPGGLLMLAGLESLDPQAAAKLGDGAAFTLDVSGLTTLEPLTAATLARNPRWNGCLPRLRQVDAATVRALTASQQWRGEMPGLQTLDADAVQALEACPRWNGSVTELTELTELTPEVAAALATSRRWDGQLPRLPSVSPGAVRALSSVPKWSGDFPGLATLTPQLAEALAGCHRWNGSLPDVVAIGSPDAVPIAAALAARKGPLKLPNLKKISPKTLTALVARKLDVEIPLIETLELISEPDGSTDDFVIPDRFQERQQRPLNR